MQSYGFSYSNVVANSNRTVAGPTPASLGPPVLSSKESAHSDDSNSADDLFTMILKDLGCSYCCKTLTNNDSTTELTVQSRQGKSAPQGPTKRGKRNPTGSRGHEAIHFNEVTEIVRRPKVTFRDGRTYDGQWRGSMRHGDGKECSKMGDFTYEGQFRDDMYHGFGTMRWSNGSKYIGNFRENQKHGWGHEFYPHGESYQGCFHNGQIDGYGTYYFKDGTTISGQWKDGRLLTSAGSSTPRLTTPSGTPATTPPRTPNTSPIPSRKLPPTVL